MPVMESVELPATYSEMRRNAAHISADDVFLMILRMAECIQRIDEDGAYRTFMELVHLSRKCRADLAAKASLFSHALIKAIDPLVSEQGNIYLRQYDCLHIDLFNLLAERFPPMIHASNAANAVAAHLMAGREEVVLLDIGIGTGRQIEAVIRTLAEHRSLPRMLTVIGVDPLCRNLEEAGSELSDLAAELELPLRFIPIQVAVEDLTAGDWTRIRQVPGDLFVTAAFSLHHIGRDETGASRKDAVLRQIRGLNPVAFVLTEPHADFETDDIQERFVWSWRFYGSCFDILDRMSFAPHVRDAAKLFFGRELEDVLGSHAAQRCERFDQIRIWLDRLRGAGFRTHPGFRQEMFRLPVPRTDPVMDTRAHRDYIGFTFEGKTISGVMCVH